MNAFLRYPPSVSSGPRLSSALLYVGAVSISVAPPAKNTFRTSLSALYSGPFGEISKLPEVPMPIAGTISPLDGILRLSMSPLAAAFASCASVPDPRSAAPVAAAVRNVRREAMICLSLFVRRTGGSSEDRSLAESFKQDEPQAVLPPGDSNPQPATAAFAPTSPPSPDSPR